MYKVFPSCSYVTSEGDEIFLNLKGNRKIFELYVRGGFGAPEIKTEERKYANGTVRTLASILQPRTVTLEMVVDGETTREKDAIFYDMVSRLLQVGTKNEWGMLKIRRTDGTDVVLHCLYTGGFDDVVECYKKYHQFQLKFRAGDPYFYDLQETIIEPERTHSLIYLNSSLFLGNWTLSDGLKEVTIDNNGEVFYPVFEITGPASNIHIMNRTTEQTLAIDSDFKLLATEKLTIDCRETKHTITHTNIDGTDGDVTNRLALGSTLLFPVIKGTNVLRLFYSDITDDSSFRIRYQKRYYSA